MAFFATLKEKFYTLVGFLFKFKVIRFFNFQKQKGFGIDLFGHDKTLHWLIETRGSF